MKRVLASLALAAAVAAPALAQTVAVTNGRVVTNTSAGVIDDGSVLMRDGDIVAVGADVEIPAEATVVDAEGGWITPGLFHPHTQLGLIEVALEDSTRNAAAGESPFSAALDVSEGFNPSGNHIDEARAEGITRFALHPSTGSTIIAGQGALADSAGAPDSVFTTRDFMVADLRRSGANLAGGSTAAAWAYLRAALDDARAYPGRYQNGGDGDVLTRADAAAMVPVARGETPLVVYIDRAADIRRALDFIEANRSLRLIIAGAAEAHLVADELAAAGVPVIMDPMRNLPDSFDTLASTLQAAARLHDAGVQVAYTTMGSDIYWNPRLLTQHAGLAAAHGAEWEEAFRAITLAPAEIYGVSDRFGALEAGYAGDVVVWDGDPLELMSAPTAVFIDGEAQSLETRQTRLRDRYAEIAAEADFAYRH
ncbi:amidohydrolase [Marinicauda salina]|uniref:Amidohydrolase n=1 Tax=Marinicauda salina TaxID=2135793 RepID=A0A2U2BTF6_9PROT|nr:amidohydrolase family protein [Marinicauda salina]PWE17286.1 amidohydrolase [Marinicauda salina]